MLKNDEVDYCTKCTVKPIVKEHMCEECYESHNEWLRELSAPKCTYCEQESEYQQDSYNLCQRCADKVNNLIIGKPKQVDDQWFTLYESKA